MNLSATSVPYLLLLLAAPLLLAFSAQKRQWLIVLVSLGVYVWACPYPIRLFALSIFVVLPYFYLKLIQRRAYSAWPLIAALTSGFICLNGYDWITTPVFGKREFLSWHILGLSYLFFRQIDVIMGATSGTVGSIRPVTYLAYLFSFWTILAGPIQRFREFQLSVSSPIPPRTVAECLTHLHRAANGLIKVVFLAAVFKNTADITGYYHLLRGEWSRLVVIFYCYPIYVYLNFSGYCDVVIGLGRWAGFSIPENFDRPYLSRNMVEFWNRWHITLSQIVRDYLYNPLLKALLSGPLSRHPNLAQYLTIVVTFFLVGIWHGSTVNFAVFGSLHALGMVASMLYRQFLVRSLGKKRAKAFSANRAVATIEWAGCMHFVCFTFLFFEYDLSVICGALLRLLQL